MRLSLFCFYQVTREEWQGVFRFILKMSKKIILVLAIVWMTFALLFPNKNRPVKIKELNYASLFNDMNDVQLNAARKLGVRHPLMNREDADDIKSGLVRIDDNEYYSVAKLTHSLFDGWCGRIT